MEKKLDPSHLDVVAFARDGASLKGQSPLAALPRLLDEQVAGDLQAGLVAWRLEGRLVPQSGGADQIWLDVQASVALPMQCQRCMGPVLVDVHAQASFRFVADEATAEAEDDESEEDLLVLTPELDVWELIEDELIMSVPIVPKHEICPATVTLSVADEAFEEALAAKPNPFAALAQLKQKPK